MPQSISVKICGLTLPQQIDDCLSAGVCACGLIFVPNSPRFLDQQRAREMFEYARQRDITTVFVFCNQAESVITDSLRDGAPDYLQFHGEESPDFCQQFGVEYIKSCSVDRHITDGGEAIDFVSLAQFYGDYARASAILLDHPRPGTGQSWPWQKLPVGLARRSILAGGLNPGNVSQALNKTLCPAIDVSSGVESTPGCKSADLIRELMSNIAQVSYVSDKDSTFFSF